MESSSTISLSRNYNRWKFYDSRHLVLFLYLIISLLLLLQHEIWKDEAHHWLLARDSESLMTLYGNSRYEGHPLLWNFLLFLITRFTDNPLSMQIFHWILGAMAVWLLLYRSALPLWIRIMLPFTHLFLYEYQVISRNYMLCIVLAFAICTLLCDKKIRYFWLALCMVLLANTHFYGLVLASGLYLVLAYETVYKKRLKLTRNNFVLFTFFCALGFGLAALQMIPPDDHVLLTNHNNAGLVSGFRLNKLLSIFFRAILHLPDIWKVNPWNNNLFFSYIPDALKAVMAIGSWFIPALLLYRKKTMLFLFYFSALTIALFAYLSHVQLAVRHSGFLLVILICAVWLCYSPVFSYSQMASTLSRFKKGIFSVLLIAIISSIMIGYIDIARPFSEAKAVIDFIHQKELEKLPLVSTQNSGPSLSAYKQEQLFYADKNAYGSFAIWNTSTFILDRQVITENIVEFSKSHDEFLIAAEYEYDSNFLGEHCKLQLLKSFDQAIVRSENFYLYHVSKIPD